MPTEEVVEMRYSTDQHGRRRLIVLRMWVTDSPPLSEIAIRLVDSTAHREPVVLVCIDKALNNVGWKPEDEAEISVWPEALHRNFQFAGGRDSFILWGTIGVEDASKLGLKERPHNIALFFGKPRSRGEACSNNCIVFEPT